MVILTNLLSLNPRRAKFPQFVTNVVIMRLSIYIYIDIPIHERGLLQRTLVQLRLVLHDGAVLRVPEVRLTITLVAREYVGPIILSVDGEGEATYFREVDVVLLRVLCQFGSNRYIYGIRNT